MVGAPEPRKHQSSLIYRHMLAVLSDIAHVTKMLSEVAELSTKVKLETISHEAVEQIFRQGQDHD